MSKGFEINRRGIQHMFEELQREFDRQGPIQIPIEADPSGIQPNMSQTIYNGPVINGDLNGQMQVAWGNSGSVNQEQHQANEVITAGFENIGQAVVGALKVLPQLGLEADDQEDATVAGEEILTEITQSEPDQGKIRRGARILMSVIGKVAAGGATGAAAGVGQLAQAAVEHLGHALGM